MKTKALLLTLVAVLIGGGAFAYMRFSAPVEDQAIQLVPKSSLLYGNLFLRPSNDQKMALDDLLQKFPGVENTDDALDTLIELFDEQLRKQDLSYEDDIEPWLGAQIAGFMTPGGTVEVPNVGILVESKDDGALREFIQQVQEKDNPEAEFVEREYEGIAYEVVENDPQADAFVFLDGFLVAGTEEAVKASIDAQAGETLQDSAKFIEATQGLRDDWLGLFYADSGALFSLFEEEVQGLPEKQAFFESFGFADQQPSAGVAYVTSDSIGFESSGGLPTEGPLAGFRSFVGSGLLPQLPAGSWAAFGVPDLGRLSENMLDLFADFPGFDREQIDASFTRETGLDLQEDVLSWMGDAGIFVMGTNVQEVGGGVVIQSTDPAKTAAALDKVQDLLQQQGLQPRPATEGELEGFSLQAPGMPAPVYFLSGDRLVITYGQSATEQAVSGEEQLVDAENFGRGVDELGDEYDVAFYVDVDAAQAFTESFMSFSGTTDPTYEEDVKQYVDPFAYVIAGSREEGESIVQRFVIGVP